MKLELGGMKILLIDNHVLFREGLASLLAGQADIQAVVDVGYDQDVLEITQEFKPTIVLMDCGSQGQEEIAIIPLVVACHLKTKVMVLAGDESEDLLFSVLRAGARGFMPKNTSFQKLLHCLRVLEQGEMVLSRRMTMRIVEEFVRSGCVEGVNNPKLASLTNREVQILRILASGLSNHEIAQRLYISENTVKIHIHNVFEKLGVKNRREASRIARQLGIPALPNKTEDSEELAHN
jgi:DNA-binding NarL/FixJ family response regulator